MDRARFIGPRAIDLEGRANQPCYYMAVASMEFLMSPIIYWQESRVLNTGTWAISIKEAKLLGEVYRSWFLKDENLVIY